MLAVTATLVGTDLQIALGAADDVAYLSNDGTNYIVRGTGLSGYAAANASVNSVAVAGTAAANQSFTVAAGVGAVLTDPLSVAASVENTSVVGAIDTLGAVTIGSGAITLAAEVTTTGKQDYQGNVGLVGTRTLSAGAGEVAFGGKVDSSAQLFADPDAFAAGTTLTNAFSGITLSDAGSSPYANVTSESSLVPTPTTGGYAPTGNRLFSPFWNAPNTILKAAFSSPVTSISLDFAPDDADDPNAYLEAYDASGNKVAAATYAPAIPELSFVTLTVSAPNIAYVLASFDPSGGNTGLLDNLRATQATTPAASLAVNSAGATTFGGVVGGTAALASLTTDGLGTTVVAGGAITTVNDQVFNDAYFLKADTTLTSNNNGTIAFKNTVDSYDATYRALTVNTDGTTEFGDGGADYVGNVFALGSITTDAAGVTRFWITPSGDATPSVKTIKTGAKTGNQIYNDDVILRANTTLTTTNGDIDFAKTLQGTTAGAQTLALTAGTGNVTFTGAVGGGTRLGAISIASATNVTANAITAASLSQAAGSGTTTLDGAVNTNAVAGVALTGTNLAVNAGITTTNSGTVTLNESGTITIAAAGDISADGAVSMTAGGGITTAGDVTTTNDEVTFASATTLSGPVAVNTGAGAGNVKFQSTLDGAQTLALNAGTGNVTFDGAVGGGTPLAGISLASAASVTAASTIKLDGTPGLAVDGITIATGVNDVTFVQSGSDIRNFSGSGVVFQGSSANSSLAGFTIASNESNGVRFATGDYTGTVLSSNVIRDNGNTTTHVGNGILVEGSNLMIGWTATAGLPNTVGNTITGNALNGIEIRGADAKNNTILSNSIYLNGQGLTQVVGGDTVLMGKGIALTANGNNGQVAPTIHDVGRDSKLGKVYVQLTVPAAGSYAVQLFVNTIVDEQGIFPADVNGFQGRTLVGGTPSGSPTPVGNGKPIISGTAVDGNTLTTIEVDAASVAAGDWITATATRLDGTTPTNTSGFSAGVQSVSAQALAVGGDGPMTWAPEYAYQLVNQNELRVFTTNTQAALALYSYRNLDIALAPASAAVGTTVIRSVASAACVGRNVVRLRLKPGAPLPAGSGNLVLAPVSLPAARIYDASTGSVILDVTASRMVTALTDPTMVGLGRGAATFAQANAFVSRFQGGMRVASADVDGDGYVDLVTAPGGGASLPGGVFGDTPRIITIYNGNPSGSWASSSINVSGDAGLAAYTGGFQVSLANVRPENTGSGNAVAELVVASANKVFVYEIAAAARGGKPVINPVVAQPAITTIGTVTGLAAGTFTSPTLADIIVATTTASAAQVKQWLASANASQSLNRPASVTVYSAAANFAPTSTFTLGQNLSNGRRLQNVFIGGAALAVGDVDNAPDRKPELILGAQSMGLANIRVLSNAVVATGNQAAVDATIGGGVNGPSRSATAIVNGKQVWQPTGGPDYFTGMSSVPNAVALGANAPVAVAVVKDFRNGSPQAAIFAALGATNSTNNVIRRMQWTGSTWAGAATLDGPGSITVLPPPGSAKTRFPLGGGLRLG